MSSSATRRPLRFAVGTTPFPNTLLDVVMPVLTDTQWRLLCVIVRATLGWQDAAAGGRKRQDWLTHGQLKARTGRSSEAISRSLDALVRQGLVEVRDEEGTPLSTPRQRRACLGRLYFALGAAALPNAEGEPVTAAPSSETEMDVPTSEITQAKTTKETHDKITPIGVKDAERGAGETPGKDASPAVAGRSRSAQAAQAPSEVKRFLLAYQERFARLSAQGERPPLSWGRDGRLVKGLLAQFGYERLIELLERFFQSKDPWVKKRGYALACFPTLLPTLLMSDPADPDGGRQTDRQNTKRRAYATPIVIHGETGRQWQQAGDSGAARKSLFERFPDLQQKVRRPPP